MDSGADDAKRLLELQHALAEAERRLHEAEHDSAAKSRFIAHISHEIRTPLNGVLGLTALALQGAESPAQRRHLEMALESGRALLQVVNDLLDFSRLAAGHMRLHAAPFNLADALAAAFRGVTPQMRSKGLLLRYDYVGGISWVHGDATRLRQIVTNLLGNAVKFTDHGEVALVTEVVARGDAGCEATIRVTDTGPGIDAATRERLFQPYAQGEAGLAQGRGGAGLGLSIARGLARAMGGDLDVDSEPGRGSTFTVHLPFQRAPDPDPQPAAPPGLAWLVFPNEHIVRWVEARLRRVGWSAHGFATLDAATIAAAQGAHAQRPQLVIVSERALAHESDVAALRRALPESRIHLLVRPDWNAPVIERAAAREGIGLIVAPLTPRDLQRITLDATAARGAAAAPPEPLPAALSGDVLLVDDNPVNQIIGEEFLKSLGLSVRTAADGEAALRACTDTPPRLVLMDVQMPRMDGREACRRLRELQQSGALPDFPIIALTAQASGQEREQCLAAGMDGYLGKPFTLELLREELVRWLPGLAPV